ncbi:cytochrome P450 [Cinnamomum micranthum f. kanehirae]|uniref:Cytochrome P450 n=1 Tax=Cinnamomum micranthum f. kanehirae TaxID=337451 RepID=A0A3S3MR76_9MAGN|nr:cytochrome P450 [Cinnamomum micranthum f. kanehirae]
MDVELHHIPTTPETTTTLPLAPLSISIFLAIIFSIASFFLLPILLRRRNWPNAPPGPIGWPILGYLPYLSDRLHEDLHKLACTYGPIFSLRLGQKRAIIVSSPDVAKEILKHKDVSFSSRTITEAVRCMAYDGTSLVFVPYGGRWRLLRRILTTELFSSRAIDLFLPARKQQVHGLLIDLYSASQTKTPVNLAESTFIASANLVSNLICSKNLFDKNKKDGRELKEMAREALEVVGEPNIADLIPVLKVFDPQGLKRRLMKTAKKFDEFFDKLIDERLEERRKGVKINDNGRMDMLDVFLDYRSQKKDDELKEFSRVDIKGMLADMFIAGTDTTSSTVEWGMTEILKNSAIHTKLTTELDRVVGRHRLVEESDIPNLPYLQSTVKELFRVHPAVPLLIPRRNDQDCHISGFHIPKHTILLVNVWGMGRDPNIWADPMEFRPERFEGSDIDVKGQDFELLPFGSGRRVCVGMPLGHRMVHYTLASLLQAFEWEVEREMVEDVREKVGITLQKKRSLVGIPKPRLPDFVYKM